LKVAVIDDEISSAELLVHFLKTYCPTVQITGMAYNLDDAIELINQSKPEVIFLDIVLNECTSFDIIEELDYTNYKVVFVTAHEEYAVKAFQYNAIDYLLKPISIEDIVTVVNKLQADLENETFTFKNQLDLVVEQIKNKIVVPDFIVVSSLKKIEFIRFDTLMYLKSDGQYTTFYLSDGTSIVASKRIGHFEEILDTSKFYRLHKSYIVNLKFIKFLDKSDGKSCLLLNNASLPISSRRFDHFTKFLLQLE
jgi:two-component system LytT family response regulator